MSRVRAAVLVGLLVGTVVVGARATSGSAGASRSGGAGAASGGQPRIRMSLAFQSPFVGAGGDFVLRLRIDRAGLPSTAEVVATVFDAVETRSEFNETLKDRLDGLPVVPVQTFPLSSLPVDPGGEVAIRLPVLDPAQPADAGRLDLGAEGVFPVRVELRERGGVTLEHFVTHLVHLPVGRSAPKLGMTLIVPVDAGIGLPPDGPRQPRGLDDVLAATQAVEGVRGLPLTLLPTPETVATLSASNDERAVKTLESLRRAAADRPTVGGPYVPVNLPALISAGLEKEVDRQIDRGTAVLSDALRARPDTRTWVTADPLDAETVDDLVRRGVERMVAVDSVLDPIPDLSLTLTRPFILDGLQRDVTAMAADPGLTSHFNGDSRQVLQAHHLLADLAVLWLDAPGSDRRAMVAVAPRNWRATRPFLDTLAGGLSQHPVAEAVSLDAAFSVTPATRRGTTLIRRPAPPAPLPLAEVVAGFQQARSQLDSLGTVLFQPMPASTLLEERLLVAASTDLRTLRQRQEYISAVQTGVSDHLNAIDLPEGRSITLTDRRGQIPMTFQNRTGYPARVVVTVQSDKLEFPEGASRPLELARRNTTERFSVVARTSGAFPLRVTLESPDGNLVIGRARLTVRSTAASRVSVAVSASALLFLAIWWGRHVVRGRRARRLLPA